MHYANRIVDDLIGYQNPADIGCWKLYEIWKKLKESQKTQNQREFNFTRSTSIRRINRVYQKNDVTHPFHMSSVTERDYTCRQLMDEVEMHDLWPDDLKQVWIELRQWKDEHNPKP